MNKPAAIYGRVSTSEQAEHGYSLPSQIEPGKQFIGQKGFDLAGIYQDDISGTVPFMSRPAGGQLQKAIALGQVKVVIVYHIDRLSRDIVDLLTTVRDWLRAGVEIYSLDVGQVTSELDIVLVIKGWQGSDERKKIIERTSRGRNSKAKSGKAVGAGTPLYGYGYSHGELFIDESQAQIVRMIFDWYIKGDENGGMMSLVSIAKRLAEMGIPTPSNAKGLRRSQGIITGWRSEVIWQILVSETYCGIWRYGKRIANGGRGGKRPIDQQIAVNVPAIVTHETWEIAQARRAYNSRISKRKMKRDYLLRGLIYCGCGRRMAGSGGAKVHPRYYYHCPRRYTSGVPAGSELCHESLVKGGLIECVTWDYIMGLITNPEQFEQKLRQAQSQEAATMQPKQKELDHIQALLKDTEKEADAIAGAIPQAKGIIRARLEQQGEEVNMRYHALTARMMVLQEALAFELTERNIDNLLEFREAVAVGLENPTFEDKRRWLELLQTKVTVTTGIAVVTCRLGGKPFEYNLSELFTSIN